MTDDIIQEFEGKTTLARHRMGIILSSLLFSHHLYEFKSFTVNEVLKTQIAQIHAFTQVCRLSRLLALDRSFRRRVEKTLTPQQWEDSQKATNATS